MSKLDDEIKQAWDNFPPPEQPLNFTHYTAFYGGYRTAYAKYAPQNKIVDLSVVCGPNSIIPMLFWQDEDLDGEESTGFLVDIDPDDDEGKYCDQNWWWPYVRFDTTRPVAWFGGEFPLPEGVLYSVWLRNGQTRTCHEFEGSWKHNGTAYDVIAFQVEGIRAEYKYSWEKNNHAPS